MKRIGMLLLTAVLLLSCLTGCGMSSRSKTQKIGVSFGVGPATRWDQETVYMEERAAELGVEIEARVNRGEGENTQYQDCVELIEAGVGVLILTTRDAEEAKAILEYAREKDVSVISYARVILGEPVDLLVGYDSGRIGQKMGQYLAEKVYEGDYILLRGDGGDNNAALLYDGAMRYIEPIQDKIHILADAEVPQWSAEEAKRIVKEVVAQNGNHVDAILAPNDVLAGASVEALEELGVEEDVIITGMDADLNAARRIVAGTQDMTVYMDLRELANIAVDEAAHMLRGETVNVNTNFDNGYEGGIPANLITGRMVVRKIWTIF